MVVGGPGGLEAPMNKVGVDCDRCGPAASMDMIPLIAEAAEEGLVPTNILSGSGPGIGLIGGGSPTDGRGAIGTSPAAWLTAVVVVAASAAAGAAAIWVLL